MGVLESSEFCDRALKAVYAFKSGVVPNVGLEELTVGRSEALSHVGAVLDGLTLDGPSLLDFVEGVYGGGKTHLLEVIGARALERGFAVSRISVNFDTVVLSRAPLVYRAIAGSLLVPDQPVTGITALLRNFVDQKHFVSQVKSLYDQWASSNNGRFDESLSIWPSALFAAVTHPMLTEEIGTWLAGKQPTIAALKVRMHDFRCVTPPRMAITAPLFSEIISGLARSLKLLGYAGLVVLIDEAENALGGMATRSQRGASVMLLNGLSRRRSPLYIAAAITPSTVVTLLGSGDYPPFLWNPHAQQAFRLVLERLTSDYCLSVSALGDNALHGLGRTIRNLHGRAFSWEPHRQLGDDDLQVLVGRVIATGEPTRVFVRYVVELLELCEQYRYLPARDLLAQ